MAAVGSKIRTRAQDARGEAKDRSMDMLENLVGLLAGTAGKGTGF